MLLLLLLVGFGLRAYRLGDKSVWWDEGLAAWAARQSLAEIAQWTSADVHPPLYFWMLHFWRLLSGDSEFGLRFLSVGVGVLTAAATYRLTQAVAGPGAGLLATTLASVSRFDVWWSQEMRMYALAALWAALALWAAIRFWDRGRLTDAVCYVLFVVAGLYTLYLSVSVLVVANLAWLWGWWRAQDRWRALARWGGAQVAALALYVPWLAYALGRMPTWSSASSVAVGEFLRIYWTVLTVGIPVNVEHYLPLTLPVLAIFLAGLIALLWRARRDRRVGRNAGLFLLGLLLPAGVVYLVSLPRETFFYSPQLAPRYLLLFAPAFYALLAWSMTRIGRPEHWPLRVPLAAIVLGVAVYGLWTYYGQRVLADDYKALAATLHAYQRPGDAVVLYPDRDWPVFAYHHPGPWHKIPHALHVTPQAAAAYLAPLWETHRGIWLVVTPYAGANDPQGEVPSWLAARAVRAVEHRFADKILRFYARTEGRAETAQELAPGVRPARSLDAELESEVWLAGYEQPVDEYRNGDTIHLFLYWEGKGGRQETVTDVEVSLIEVSSSAGGSQGTRGSYEVCHSEQAWKEVRSALPVPASGGRLTRQQVDLVVPPDVPTGRYAFAVRASPGERAACFGKVSLRPPQHVSTALTEATIAHPVEVDFGSGVRLLGYDLDAKVLAPGDMLYLTLYWQARHPVERRYKMFTHVLGEVFNAESGSFLWGQQDNEPANGMRPTSTWRAGEVIVDGYGITLDPRASSGTYAIEVGLYDPANLERLPVLDGQGQVVADHLLLAHIEVESD